MQLPKKLIIHKHFTSNFKYLNQILSQKILTYFCQNNLFNNKCNFAFQKLHSKNKKKFKSAKH